MSLSSRTQQELIELVRLLTQTKGKSVRRAWQPPFRFGMVPEDIEGKGSEGASLIISGEEYVQYSKCVRSLEAESSLEHLSRREVDRELWRLVCEAVFESGVLGDKAAIKREVASFQQRVSRPIEQYEVLIPLEGGLRLGGHDLEIGGIKLFEMSGDDARNWGIVEDRPIYENLYHAVVNGAVAVIHEKGCDPWKVAERARDRLSVALSTLRVALLMDHEPRVLSWKVHDEQMLFRQGESIGVKKLGSREPLLPGWKLGFRSVGFTVDDVIAKQIAESSGLIDCLFKEEGLQGRIRDRLVRAMEWIGDSVTREGPDAKVVDICTALETLLTTKGDKRKAEAIALRMMLLYSLSDRPFFDPAQVLELYGKRSDVVHGSNRDICTDSDYSTGRRISVDVLQTTLAYVRKNRITQHGDFIRSLLTDEALVSKAVDYWKEDPEYRKGIEEAAKQSVQKPAP